MSSFIGIFALSALSLFVILLPLWTRRADRGLGQGIETNDITKQWEDEKDRLVKEQHDLDVALMEGRISKELHEDEREQVARDAERALQRLRDARKAMEKSNDKPKTKPRVYPAAGSVLAGIILLSTGFLTFYLNGFDVQRQVAQKTPGPEDIAKMVASLEQRVKSGQGSMKDQLMLARSYLVLGRRNESITLYDKIQNDDPKNLQAIMALGEIYFSSKDKDDHPKALPYFEKALIVKPDMPEALWYKSLDLVRKRRLDEARNVLERLRDIASDNKQAQDAVKQLLAELDKTKGKAPLRNEP